AVQARANMKLRTANTRLDQQRKRAEAREQQAIDAVKSFGDAVTDSSELKNNRGLESLRKELLKRPLEFFKSPRDQLQAARDTSPQALARLAGASFDLGILTNEIGDTQDALIAHWNALAIRQKLADANPTVTAFQSGVADSHNRIGILLSHTGKTVEAMKSY